MPHINTLESNPDRLYLNPHKCLLATLALLLLPGFAHAQKIPGSPAQPWRSPQESDFRRQLAQTRDTRTPISPHKIYSLAELIDLAEHHNPRTRIAWEQAKQRATELGIVRSSLFPLISASAILQQDRTAVFFGGNWFRQDIGKAEPAISLLYTVFDFGRRGAAIDSAAASVIEANFSFNTEHEQIIFDTTASYYQLLNAKGQVEAATSTLNTAQTTEEAAEARLKNGLATLPDVLEAKASTAQAAFDLETARRAERIALGNLAETLDIPPTEGIEVADLSKNPLPDHLSESVNQAINRALVQRPDLLAQAANMRAANANVARAKDDYYPKVTFAAEDDYVWAKGQQPGYPVGYARGKAWTGQLSLTWTIFDGRERYNRLDRARSQEREAAAQLAELRNRAETQVWTAYSNVQTAFQQNKAAVALLAASDQSFQASLEAYKYGVKNFLDVVTAQRILAQARFAQVQAQTQLLTDLAGLAFQTGDLLNLPVPPLNPKP